MDLIDKIMDAFIGKVVRKDLVFLVRGGAAHSYIRAGIPFGAILCKQR